MSKTDALAFLFDLEKGDYDGTSPQDPNVTRDGVIQATYDTYRDRKGVPRRSVLRMTDDERAEVYDQFWTDSQAEQLPAPVAILHNAFYFNTYPSRAVKALQRAVGTVPDGQWGPKTRAAIQVASQNPERFFRRLMASQAAAYRDIMRANRAKVPNGPSWIDRLVRASDLFDAKFT